MISQRTTVGLHRPVVLILCLFLALALAGNAQATQRTWSNSGTTWSTGTDWGGTAPINSLTTDTALFNSASYTQQPNVTTSTSVAGITANGAGNLTITETGALSIGSSGFTIGSAAGTVTLSGTTDIGASQSWANNSANLFTVGTVSNIGNSSPFTLTLSGSGAGGTTFGGIISNGGTTGTLGLTINTTNGTTTLSNTNTYTGATTVSGGALSITGSIGSGGTGTAITVSGGTLTEGATNSITGSATSLAVSSGTATLSQANNFAGATALSSTGTLQLQNAGSIASSALTLSGGTLQLRNDTNNTTFSDASTTISGSTTINVDSHSGATVTGNTLLLGAIGIGANTVTLTNADSYNLTVGTVTASAGPTFTNNMTSGTTTIGALTLTPASTQTATFNGTSATAITSVGVISQNTTHALAVTQSGSGTLILTGNNTYTGLTTVSSGTLTLAGSNTSATGGVTITGGTLNINSPTALGATAGTLTIGPISSGTITIDNTNSSFTTSETTNNPITINDDFTFGGTNNLNLGSGTVTIASGSSETITLDGTGSTLTLGGNVITPTSHPTVDTLTVNGAGNTLVFGSIALNGSTHSDGNVFNGTGNLTITGNVTPGGSSGNPLTYSGSGTMIIDGASTYTGNTTISSGTLEFGSEKALYNDATGSWTTSKVKLSSGATYAFKVLGTATTGAGLDFTSADIDTLKGLGVTGSFIGLDTTDGNFTYANDLGSIVSGQGLKKLGINTLTLSGTNSYTGATTILGGVLAVNGSLNVNSAVTIGGTGATGTPTLTGTGSVLGAITDSGTSAAGTINPGGVGTTGTLTVGSITFQSGSTFAIDMSGAATDKLVITNAATINSGADISITASGLTLGNYVLATAASGLNSAAFTVTGSLPTGYKLVATSTALDLQALASQSFTAPSTINIITGSTTTVSATLTNGSPTGGTALAVSLANNGGTGGTVSSLSAVSGSTVGTNSSTTVSGTFTATTVGIGNTWSIKNTDANAAPTTATATGTANVYNHSAPTLTVTGGAGQSGIVGSTLSNATLTLADTAGATPAPLDVNTLSNLTGGSTVASGSTGTYTSTALNTSTAGVGETLAVSLKAGDQQSITGASALSTLNQTITYNVYNHSAPTLTLTGGNNQSGIVGSTLSNATLTLADTAGTVPAPLDVNTLSNLTGGSTVASNSTGTYTSTALNTSTAGVGETLAVSLKAGDQQSITGASALSTLGQTVTYNVYNHSTPTLIIAGGNNQSVILGTALSAATTTLTDTTGTIPAPLDVNTLSNLTGGSTVASNSTGTYTVTGFNGTVGAGQTLLVSLKAGDQQSITGANALSTLSQNFTYNIYNHSAPTLTLTGGNNQSGIVGSTLSNATLTLADTAGTVPAPLDVNTLSNLTGGSTVASNSTGTYTSTALNTSTAGVGETLAVSLKAGDQQSITGASALSTLGQTVTYNVYNHSTPTLIIAGGNNQSVILGTALSAATTTLTDTTGTIPAPLDVNTLSNLTGGSTVASNSTGTYTATGFNNTVVGIGKTLTVSLKAGDQQSITGANALSTLSQNFTYNVYNHATGGLTTGTLTLGPVHVGYTSPVASSNSLTATNGTVGDDRVNLQGSAPASGNITLTSLSGIVSGGNGAISATLGTGQGVGTISTPVTYTFADQSAIAGTSSNVGTASLTVSGLVYSGVSTWAAIGTSGSWGTLASGFGTNWGTNQGSPGLDPSFTGVDTATFGTVAGGSSTDTVSLNGASPNLNSITFNSSSTSYTLAQGSGGAITLSGTTPGITVTAGIHAISAPVILGAATSVNVASGQQFAFSGVVSGSNGLTMTGAGTTVLSGSSANTYTGETTVSGGELDLGKTASVVAIKGAGAENVASPDINVTGGLLKFLANDQLGNSVDSTGNVTLALSSGATVDLHGTTQTLYSYKNSGGTIESTGGRGKLVGTGATATFDGGTNNINSNTTTEDTHIAIGPTTTTTVVVHGSEGNGIGANGILQLDGGGTGLQFSNGSTLQLNSDNQTAGSLELGGSGATTISVLDATSNFITSNGANTNPGTINLNTHTAAFSVASGGNLGVGAVIGDGTGGAGAISKAGSGTLTLTSANTYSGGTAVTGGTLYVNNTSGSGTGTGAITVAGSSALGGSGIIKPGSGNGITLASGGTLISGAVQAAASPTTLAGTGLTLDNSVAAGTILDASVGSADLTFSLGAGNPTSAGTYTFNNPNTASTYMTVLGNTAGEIKFAAGDTITLTDLTVGNLQLNLSVPYLLIQAGTTPNELIDNNLYAGLTTSGGVVGGVLQNGWVTTPLTLNGSVPGEYAATRLYLYNGDLEVVPEPGTWAMMIGGFALLVFIQRRRRQH